MTRKEIDDIFREYGQYATGKEYALVHAIAEAVAPQRKPLTFEQVEDCFPEGAIFAEDDGWLRVSAQTLHDFARAIEAKLKEKNI